MTPRQITEAVALLAALVFGGLAWHNASVNQAIVATGSAPSAVEWLNVAGTSLAAIMSALTAVISFVLRVWKPTSPQGVSTLELLKAVAVILQQMPVFKQMQDAYAAHGLPTFVRLEVGWNGQTPLTAGWDMSPPETPAAPVKAEVKP